VPSPIPHVILSKCWQTLGQFLQAGRTVTLRSHCGDERKSIESKAGRSTTFPTFNEAKGKGSRPRLVVINHFLGGMNHFPKLLWNPFPCYVTPDPWDHLLENGEGGP